MSPLSEEGRTGLKDTEGLATALPSGSALTKGSELGWKLPLPHLCCFPTAPPAQERERALAILKGGAAGSPCPSVGAACTELCQGSVTEIPVGAPA